MADQIKDNRAKEILIRTASKFFELESNKTSLITVTNVEIFAKGKEAKVFITVFPSDKEPEALDFLKRKRTELREFIRKDTKLPVIPFLDVLIDQGEKNRQRIEQISHSN
jgi:ribosome-binding factor A